MHSIKIGSQSENDKLKLAVFDLDGTLTAIRSPFFYISEKLGFGEEARTFAIQYEDGKIGYEDWGRGIVSLWKGVKNETIKEIAKTIPFREGAIFFLKELQERGVFTAILSVAFEQHVAVRAKILNIDHFNCNELIEANGIITGEYRYRINHSNKSNFVKELQRKLKISKSNTITAGDTTGDIAMFNEASLSIAVNPENDEVVKSASKILPNDNWGSAMNILKESFDLT